MNRDIKITKAGYLYINGKKASPRRITPLYVGADILDPKDIIQTRQTILQSIQSGWKPSSKIHHLW